MSTRQNYSSQNVLFPPKSQQYQAFPVNKIFRRYLERKLEADSIELEARKKNISLTELEEERLSSCRKLRRKVREHNNGKMKLTK